VRLLIQGCLILGLCFLSAPSFAIDYGSGYGEGRDGWTQYANRKCGMSWVDGRNPTVQDDYDEAHGCAARDEETLTSYWLPRCQNENDRCKILPWMDLQPHQSGFYLGRPQVTGGYYESVYFYAGPNTPEYCREKGENFNPYADEGMECTKHCQHGSFNGTCLSAPEPEDEECTPESPDYRGELVLGYGTEPASMCGDYDQCSGDGTGGTVGVVNGEIRCLADDYGAPKCKGGTISVIDEHGFVCETLQNQPDPDEVAEAPNTDTDGDGEPDEYQRENDPESVDKGLDKVADAIGEGNEATDKSNQHLAKIESHLEGIGSDLSSLKTMGENGELAGGGGGSGGGDGTGLVNDQGEDYLGDLADIKQNTKDTADRLEEIKDGPDDGYSTDNLGDAPTFADSSERLFQLISTNPTIEAVTTIPSISSNNTCPVWTIPATDFWKAMPIDSHCQILSDHRGLLSILFVAVWTLAAVFVFLRA
jgi:hypothetical protein